MLDTYPLPLYPDTFGPSLAHPSPLAHPLAHPLALRSAMLAKMQPVAAALLALAATATAEEICGNITLDENLRLCKGGSGIFFPVYPTAQAEWSQTTQVILYVCAPIYHMSHPQRYHDSRRA